MGPGGVNPSPAPSGPTGAPMSQPSPNDGARQIGMVQVETGMQMLERALPALGMNTPEHAAVLKALSALSSAFQRQKSEALVPAQIAEMAKAQQGSPVQQMIPGGGAGQQPPQQPQQPPMQH